MLILQHTKTLALSFPTTKALSVYYSPHFGQAQGISSTLFLEEFHDGTAHQLLLD